LSTSFKVQQLMKIIDINRHYEFYSKIFVIFLWPRQLFSRFGIKKHPSHYYISSAGSLAWRLWKENLKCAENDILNKFKEICEFTWTGNRKFSLVFCNAFKTSMHSAT
jgi:hypothetical protein